MDSFTHSLSQEFWTLLHILHNSMLQKIGNFLMQGPWCYFDFGCEMGETGFFTLPKYHATEYLRFTNEKV